MCVYIYIYIYMYVSQIAYVSYITFHIVSLFSQFLNKPGQFKIQK